MRRERVLVWSGSAILVGTAVLHATGWSEIAGQADRAQLGPFLAAFVKASWLFVGYHWLAVAVLAAVAVLHRTPLARAVLLALSVLLAADVALLLLSVGPFIGPVLLGASALTYTAGALLTKDMNGSAPGA